MHRKRRERMPVDARESKLTRNSSEQLCHAGVLEK